MNVKIIPSVEFDRQFKRLAKKYKSLLDDYLTFSKELKENPLQGAALGRGVRKIRMAIDIVSTMAANCISLISGAKLRRFCEFCKHIFHFFS